MAAAVAKRYAAITVLCGIVSDQGVKRLSLEWGLVVLLLQISVHGYLCCAEGGHNNEIFRNKFRGLAPSVAIHPDASDVNVDSDDFHRLPVLCLRALTSMTKHYFPKGKRYKKFTLQQTQLIRGGLLSTCLEMQKSITGK
jgi:hypothetical protein